MEIRESVLDEINQATWKETVSIYARSKGWSDPGEQAAIGHIAQEMHSLPVLDIGVGAGRTTEILRSISDDYIGVDYTTEMIDAARRRYTSVKFEHMDARDLSKFADNQFALVVFSFNGIDSIHFTDRLTVLRETCRVLRPNGVFIFSSHNRRGPGCGEHPTLRLEVTRNPLRLGWRFAKQVCSFPTALRNYRRFSALNEMHDDWAVGNCGAHNFGIVITYTTLSEQMRQFAATGFSTEIVFDNLSGDAITDETPTNTSCWFHYVARKVATG